MKTLLGKTSSGKPVYAPTRGTPDTNNIDTFINTRRKFIGWTKADGMDAAKLCSDAADVAEADGNRKLKTWLRHWSWVYWDICGRWTSPEYDAHVTENHESVEPCYSCAKPSVASVGDYPACASCLAESKRTEARRICPDFIF